MISYRNDVLPELAAICDLYRLAQLRRPVDDLDRMVRMFAGANLVHTAWHGERLVGILRGWTDEGYDGYICDLAVHPEYQRQGIGKKLLEQVQAGRPEVQFILRASAIAKDYYEHIGWQMIENGWFAPREPWS